MAARVERQAQLRHGDAARRGLVHFLHIGGQTRADFFKSLHVSAKFASGELFADFLQTFCRLFLWIIYSHAHFLHTFCTLSAANDSSCADFVHTYSVFADFLQNICTLFAENMLSFCRLHAHLF